ncbi:MAG: NUDIX hydrolase [Chitinophagaceae bacterium]|nr:NUDIX hydrolase [Chitinophagaceae bacterium]
MTKYQKQTRLLAAVDCIVFGFDGHTMRLLLIQRALEAERGKWSLMGGFVQPHESADEAAKRVLHALTGLQGVYLEQLHTFSDPARDPIERTLSIAYFSLIDISQYEKQLSEEYHAEWFDLSAAPRLIFDHNEMVAMAKEKLRYKAALHPLLFELLPKKFTLPQLQTLFEGVYETKFDKRNFSRKLLSTGLLVRQADKDMSASRKGAFYYKLNSKNYKAKFQDFLNLIPRTGAR